MTQELFASVNEMQAKQATKATNHFSMPVSRVVVCSRITPISLGPKKWAVACGTQLIYFVHTISTSVPHCQSKQVYAAIRVPNGNAKDRLIEET
jgi:hypothetical protein